MKRDTLAWMAAMVFIAGWWPGTVVVWQGEERIVEYEMCTITRITWDELSCEKFVRYFMGKQPVIVFRGDRLDTKQGSLERNQDKFAKACAKESLLESYGDLPVKISTANAYTGRKWSEMSLKQYLEYVLRPQDATRHGNQTLYLFGSQHGEGWDQFLAQYEKPGYPSESLAHHLHTLDPDVLCRSLDSLYTTLSFGIAGANTGVPFHFHGPGFLEVLVGRKRWLLYPPETTIPLYDPNATTLAWTEKSLPRLDRDQKPLDCVVHAGEMIYFPNQWLHATLNLEEYNVFMATFA